MLKINRKQTQPDILILIFIMLTISLIWITITTRRRYPTCIQFLPPEQLLVAAVFCNLEVNMTPENSQARTMHLMLSQSLVNRNLSTSWFKCHTLCRPIFTVSFSSESVSLQLYQSTLSPLTCSYCHTWNFRVHSWSPSVIMETIRSSYLVLSCQASSSFTLLVQKGPPIQLA